jgi:hypothetical protein
MPMPIGMPIPIPGAGAASGPIPISIFRACSVNCLFTLNAWLMSNVHARFSASAGLDWSSV